MSPSSRKEAVLKLLLSVDPQCQNYSQNHHNLHFHSLFSWVDSVCQKLQDR